MAGPTPPPPWSGQPRRQVPQAPPYGGLPAEPPTSPLPYHEVPVSYTHLTLPTTGFQTANRALPRSTSW